MISRYSINVEGEESNFNPMTVKALTAIYVSDQLDIKSALCIFFGSLIRFDQVPVQNPGNCPEGRGGQTADEHVFPKEYHMIQEVQTVRTRHGSVHLCGQKRGEK